jgi:hypothetical protein
MDDCDHRAISEHAAIARRNSASAAFIASSSLGPGRIGRLAQEGAAGLTWRLMLPFIFPQEAPC